MDTGFGRGFNEHIERTIERFEIRRVADVPVYECHALRAQPVQVPFGSSAAKVVKYDDGIVRGIAPKIPRQRAADKSSATGNQNIHLTNEAS